jgi:hypothetical protein
MKEDQGREMTANMDLGRNIGNIEKDLVPQDQDQEGGGEVTETGRWVIVGEEETIITDMEDMAEMEKKEEGMIQDLNHQIGKGNLEVDQKTCL